MLLMLLIGWIVLLPAVVVAGLYVGSTVLGRRRATLPGYEDLFAEDQGLDTDLPAVTPEAITGQAASAPGHRAIPADAPATGAPPVGAGY
jgi:hypothetical protein